MVEGAIEGVSDGSAVADVVWAAAVSCGDGLCALPTALLYEKGLVDTRADELAAG